MRASHWMVVAALAVGCPSIARAQEPGNPGSRTSPPATQTSPAPRPALTPESTVPPTPTASGPSGFVATVPSHWIASGFVGSNFGASADSASVDFGGQVGYLWQGIAGAELLGDFGPKFKVNNALLADNPTVNAYMVNGVGALPLGADRQIQPYVSAGVGGIQLRSDVLGISATTSANAVRAGADVGFGVMGYAGNVGVRGDVRYFRAFTNDNIDLAAGDALAQTVLSGLNFWRANIGVAVRW